MKTSELIDNLTENTQLVKAEGAFMDFVKWLAFSAVYLAAAIFVLQLRDDISLQFQKPLFMFEIISLAILALTVGIASIIASYPDSYQKRSLLYLPLLPLVSFMIILFLQAEVSMNLVTNLDGEFGCFLCICLAALEPGFYLLKILKKNATTSPSLAGALSTIAAFSFGALVVRLTEKVDSMEHIIWVHYVPMLFIAVIGMYIGRKFLKW